MLLRWGCWGAGRKGRLPVAPAYTEHTSTQHAQLRTERMTIQLVHMVDAQLHVLALCLFDYRGQHCFSCMGYCVWSWA